MAIMQAYSWLGNIRQLENALEYASIVCGKGPVSLNHLHAEFPGTGSVNLDESLRGSRDLAEIEQIRTALHQSKGNRLEAAKILGVHKTTLFRKLKQFGIR